MTKGKLHAYVRGKDRVQLFIASKIYNKKDGEGGYVYLSKEELVESIKNLIDTLTHAK